MTRARISVIGLGFVGLSLTTINAKMGFYTIGVDIDDKKIDSLKAGKPGFFEPKLDRMLKDSIKQKSIEFTTDLGYAVQNSDITFLTVGTPLRNDSDEVDLSYVRTAVRQIAMSLQGKKTFHLLVIKSTMPPLTTESTILPVFSDLIKDGRTDVVVNPEFLREGFAIDDLLKPHLIVIGSRSEPSSRILEEYYKSFYETLPEIVHTNIPTAEMIKYANNAFLATKISFINSIGTLCQSIPGSDVNTVAYAIGKDSRIGSLFLQAGPGFGGSCLPKDLVGLIRLSQETGGMSDLFAAVKQVNDQQFLAIMEMMKEQGVLAKGRTVAVLGLAFKKDTDDVRNAVSVRVVGKMLEYGLKVRVHDPMALNNFRRIFGTKISYVSSIDACLDGSDCCVILTDWDVYKRLRQDSLQRLMRSCNIIDAKRILDQREFQMMNFKAIGLGN